MTGKVKFTEGIISAVYVVYPKNTSEMVEGCAIRLKGETGIANFVMAKTCLI